MDCFAALKSRFSQYRLLVLDWYTHFLVTQAWNLIGASTFIVLCAALTSVVPQLGAMPLPSFDVPSKGFEPRGSTIMRRIIAYNNLEYVIKDGIQTLATSTRPPILTPYKVGSSQRQRSCSVDPRSYLRAVTVYSSENGDSMFKAKYLRAMCELENSIVRSQDSFNKYCDQNGNFSTGDCCPSLSLGLFVARLNNKLECAHINDTDVANTLSLLRSCKPFLDKGMLSDLCLVSPSLCREVPPQCLAWNAVSSIFNFMVDKEFVRSVQKSDELKYAVTFSPLVSPSNQFLEDLYLKTLENIAQLKKNGVRLVAHDFYKLKTMMFEKRILIDLSYVISAMALVIFLMWIYSRSLFVSLLGFATIINAIILSYWMYSVLFRLRFFPVLNVLTAIFIVGIGADDIFVYVSAWNHAKSRFPTKSDNSLPRFTDLISWTKYALEHAAASMFVTSFTTAAAFFVGYASNITAVRCFAIFAGTSIMTNFFLMISWFPAVMIINERSKRVEVPVQMELIGVLPDIILGQGVMYVCQKLKQLLMEYRERFQTLPEKLFGIWIINIIIKGRFFLVSAFVLLSIGGLICITVYPKLKLPSSQKLQLFIKTHPMEQYEFTIRQELQIDTSLGAAARKFPLIFVWGIHAKDTGSYLDPDSLGRLVWDASFDLASLEAQMWTSQLCKKIRNASFYGSGDCFLDKFYSFSQVPCNTAHNRTCCNHTAPLAGHQFRTCVKEYATQNVNRTTEDFHFVSDEAGNIKLIFLKFDSEQSFQFQFSPVDDFWHKVKSWADKQLSDAPVTMKNGWIISDLYFYDLQRSVAAGTPKTIGISIAISAGVLLLTTQNLVITFYAVCSISGIISVTIGALVLSGWELNVLESMTMSVAVGLSIDITLHYGVGYFLCPDSGNRIDRVRFSLWHVGSAVTMGMTTTFIAGLVMMPSNIFAYIQVGHFLMLNMSISWLFGTFFFLPINAIIGPEGDCGNLFGSSGKSNKITEVEL